MKMQIYQLCFQVSRLSWGKKCKWVIFFLALGQIAKLEPSEFKKHSSTVIDFVVDEVLPGKVTKVLAPFHPESFWRLLQPSPRKSKKQGHSPIANKTRPASGDLKGFGARLLAKYLEGRHVLVRVVN
jgi:hypothetical protein